MSNLIFIPKEQNFIFKYNLIILNNEYSQDTIINEIRVFKKKLLLF